MLKTLNSNILIIDDDEVDYLQLRKILEKSGYEFELYRAMDGLEALELLRGKGDSNPIPVPKIIFLDLNMPRMNGLEFLDEIRLDPFFGKIPIVIFSTSIDKSNLNKPLVEPVAGYVIKPTTLDNIIESSRNINSFLENCHFSRI